MFDCISKYPANASTAAVDVQGAAAPWEKLKKVLKKATAFFNCQFNNSIIRGLSLYNSLI